MKCKLLLFYSNIVNVLNDAYKRINPYGRFEVHMTDEQCIRKYRVIHTILNHIIEQNPPNMLTVLVLNNDSTGFFIRAMECVQKRVTDSFTIPSNITGRAV